MLEEMDMPNSGCREVVGYFGGEWVLTLEDEDYTVTHWHHLPPPPNE